MAAYKARQCALSPSLGPPTPRCQVTSLVSSKQGWLLPCPSRSLLWEKRHFTWNLLSTSGQLYSATYLQFREEVVASLVLQISTNSVKVTWALILSVSFRVILRCLEPTKEEDKWLAPSVTSLWEGTFLSPPWHGENSWFCQGCPKMKLPLVPPQPVTTGVGTDVNHAHLS